MGPPISTTGSRGAAPSGPGVAGIDSTGDVDGAAGFSAGVDEAAGADDGEGERVDMAGFTPNLGGTRSKFGQPGPACKTRAAPSRALPGVRAS
ncbi:hypothetical protein ROR02_08760 [Pararhodospirillum oryzae]|uniref:Uncharacterized protein n=1 Tax=Pararhodospirillum oryzae TaxID=478448 RepID=A0A512H5J8_9PROT|nr:hypothetical protein ROR02_08760 [Pararhodospirillum oryzae]